MQSDRTFCLGDGVVAVVLTVLLIAVASAQQPNTGTRDRAQMQKHALHVVGMHNGLILYAQGNNDWYPGVDAQGKEQQATKKTANSIGSGKLTGYHPGARIVPLLNGNFFTPDYAISPLDKEKSPAKNGQDISSSNYSWAMLRLSDEKATGRRSEWHCTINSQAAAVADRNTAAKAGKDARSILDGDNGWQGTIAWNDNHVEIVRSNVQRTSFGQAQVGKDDLFADDKDDNGKTGNDAAMVYHDASSYVDQK